MKLRRVMTCWIMVAIAGLPLAAAPVDTSTGAAKSGVKTQHRTKGQGSPQAARRKFVLEVVQSAVALPQPSLQDRLRVLNSAANVIAPLDAKLARRFVAEGTRIESELIRQGQTPAVSMLADGPAECISATRFVESVEPQAVVAAEQSLIGAVSKCPRETLPPVQQKLETALNQGVVAPRALLAVVEAIGAKTPWAQTQLRKLFASLPLDANVSKAEAPNYAAMYVRVAPELEKGSAREGGVKLLAWLGNLPDAPERSLAIHMTSDAMREALGAKDYEEALASDIMARQAVNNPGQEGEIEHPAEESVSVLEAMGNTGSDQTDSLVKMAPSLRARQAAAHGFATGTDGDPKLASHYFDMAFSAVDEVWANRDSGRVNAPAVVEEVSEAAAQVDPVTALHRTQTLADPSAQAIGMLAVARVVNGQE